MLERLQAIQGVHGWTNAEMAARLGVSEPMWRALKAGKSRLGADSLGGVLKAFPELEAEVLAYLRGDEVAA